MTETDPDQVLVRLDGNPVAEVAARWSREDDEPQIESVRDRLQVALADLQERETARDD